MFYWKGIICPNTYDKDGDGNLVLLDFDVDEEGTFVGIDALDGDGDVQADDLDRLIAENILFTGLADGTALVMAAELADVGSADDGEINTEAEFLALLALLDNCEVIDDWVWIFDIADIVIHGFNYENDGAKLVQIRFYDANAANVQYGGDAPIPSP